MKNLILLCLSLFSFCANAEEILVPEYNIRSDKKDPSLSDKEAVVELKFFDSAMKAVKQVTLAYGGPNEVVKTGNNNIAYLKLVPDTYTFAFYYNGRHSEVRTGKIKLKPGHRMRLEVYFHPVYVITVVDKPVIYVYPQKKTEINIQLDVHGKMLFSYPEYKSGWHFTANEKGEIFMNDKTCHYLFWDAAMKLHDVQLKEGFDLNKKHLVQFFEEKLLEMGLKSKEAEDFITYWCPRMQQFENVRLAFVFNQDYDRFASLQIQPPPDHLFRVMMIWRELNPGEKAIPGQKLEKADRSGFHIIEWGGTQLPSSEFICD